MHIRQTTSSPLYMELADKIRSAINAGSYPIGSKIPSESELIADAGVSHSTVRKAIDMLVEEQLVERRQGKGTFVIASMQKQPSPAPSTSFLGFTAGLHARGMNVETKTVSIKTVIPDSDISEFLDIAAAEPVIEIVRLRSVEHAPFCLESCYLSSDYQKLCTANLDGSLYSQLKTLYNRTAADGYKRFDAQLAGPNEAFLLNVPKGTPLIFVTDYVRDEMGKPLHVSRRAMRTDQTAYVEKIV